jgi:hypothetical protein
MNSFDDQALDEGLMDELDLPLGFYTPREPPRGGPTAVAVPEDDDRDGTHHVNILDIQGRAYLLDCRIDPVSRVVLQYSLRRAPKRRGLRLIA